jgi:hypothetical protein
MKARRWIAALTLCAIVCALFLLVVEQAQAARGGGTSDLDKELSSRHGLKGSLATSKSKGKGTEEEEKKGPTKFQMFLGVASIFVMIAVVKWV